MKPLFFLLIFAIVLAFASCKQKHNETTGTPNTENTGPTDTTKMSETGSTPGISAQGQTKSLDTNHNVKVVSDSLKK
jgi:hypothetical protein